MADPSSWRCAISDTAGGRGAVRFRKSWVLEAVAPSERRVLDRLEAHLGHVEARFADAHLSGTSAPLSAWSRA